MEKWIKDGLISAVFGVFIVLIIFSLIGYTICIYSIIIGSCIGGFGISYLKRNKNNE